MRNAQIAFLVLFLSVQSTSAGPIDKERLKAEISLPRIACVAGVGFNSEDGMVLPGEKKKPRERLADLQGQLRGHEDDAELHYRIAECHKELEQKDQAQASYDRAIRIYRTQVQQHPKDGFLLSKLGESLAASGQSDEGDKLIRRSVEVSPGDWRCWTALGDHLAWDRLAAEVFDNTTRTRLDFREIARLLVEKKPPAEALVGFELAFADGNRCFDRAIASAPRESRAYMRRAAARMVQGTIRENMRVLGGQGGNPSGVMFTPDIVADLRRAADLTQDDYKTLGFAAIVELASAAPSSEHIESWLGKLTRLSISDKKATAVGALEVLGVVQMLYLEQHDKGEQCLRRVLQADPSREHIWDLLTAYLATHGRMDETIALSRERLRHKDSAHNRFMLAKALERSDLKQCEAEIRRALELDSNHVLANLSDAVLNLKRGDGASLEAARKRLDAVDDLLRADKDPDYSAEERSDREKNRGQCSLARCAYSILQDQPGAAKFLLNVSPACKEYRLYPVLAEMLGATDAGTMPDRPGK